MSKPIYLLTGFLGSGKTTALHELNQYFPNKKIVYIINEYSKGNVDSSLISDLKGRIEEITYGLISCQCKLPMFEAMLDELSQTDVDIIFIEASGLADPKEVEDTIEYVSNKNSNVFDYKGAICLVDAQRFIKSSQTNRRVLQQLALADLIILNRIDLVDQQTLAETNKRISAMKPNANLIQTTFAKLPYQDEKELDKALITKKEDSWSLDEDIQSYALKRMIIEVSQKANVAEVEHFLRLISDDTYRIKGFCSLSTNDNEAEIKTQKYLVDCVGTVVQVNPIEKKILHPDYLNQLYVIYDSHFDTENVVNEAIRKVENNYFLIAEIK